MKQKFVLLNLTILTLAMGIHFRVNADDTPDESVEGGLHKTYETSNSKPTPAGSWNAALSLTGVRTYVVKKGENLKDISKLLFGDKKYWTKIWATNPHVTNPYEIAAGTILKFRGSVMKKTKTGESLPTLPVLEMIEGEIDKEQVAPEVLALTLNVEIPAPTKTSKPLLKKLPKSIPAWDFARTSQIPSDLQLARPIGKNFVHQMPLSYYMNCGEVFTVGEVVQTEMGFVSASDYQQVFIRIDDDESLTEKTFVVIKEQEIVEDPFTGRSGTLIQVQGELQILERVNDGERIYRAFVKNSILPVEVGAKVSVGELQYVDATDTGTVSTVDANIFSGQYGHSRKLYSANTLVFLNAGVGAGIQEGTILPIYKDQRRRTAISSIEQLPKMIGKLKVVRVNGHFSTALVIANGEEVYNGDGTSPESVLPRK